MFGGKQSKDKTPDPAWKPFVVSPLAGCAAVTFTHPADTIKVRMQISGMGMATNTVKEGIFKTGERLIKSEGVAALYNGLTASLLRQVTYTNARFGLYLKFKEYLSKDGKDLNVFEKIGASMLAGAGGAMVGSPADVVLVRMQADGKLPVEQRRNYKHAIDGLIRIVKSEGVAAMWKGCVPNVNRAMLMTAGQLASYDQVKGMMLATPYFQEGTVTHFTASLFAGFVAAVVTNPIDVIKTRIMNQQKGSGIQYRNSFECASKMMLTEGPMSFYKGFIPYFARLAPTTILTFIFFEKFAVAFDYVFKR